MPCMEPPPEPRSAPALWGRGRGRSVHAVVRMTAVWRVRVCGKVERIWDVKAIKIGKFSGTRVRRVKREVVAWSGGEAASDERGSVKWARIKKVGRTNG